MTKARPMNKVISIVIKATVDRCDKIADSD